jgi:plasmid stability protein
VGNLKKRAARHGRSLQSELKAILEEAARGAEVDSVLLAARVRGMFKGRKFSDSTALIREDRDRR